MRKYVHYLGSGAPARRSPSPVGDKLKTSSRWPALRARPVRARCTNGKIATSVWVERRHDGALYIYGIYYENGKKHKCYVGPADPDYVLRSMPAAFLVEPDVWGPALLEALKRAVENAVAERRREAVEWLRRIGRRLNELVEEAEGALREERGGGLNPSS